MPKCIHNLLFLFGEETKLLYQQGRTKQFSGSESAEMLWLLRQKKGWREYEVHL